MDNESMEYFYKEKLRAFCEGLEMQDIDKLLTGSIADFKRIGEIMAERIKERIK